MTISTYTLSCVILGYKVYNGSIKRSQARVVLSIQARVNPVKLVELLYSSVLTESVA